jgi:hypothetical protein
MPRMLYLQSAELTVPLDRLSRHFSFQSIAHRSEISATKSDISLKMCLKEVQIYVARIRTKGFET